MTSSDVLDQNTKLCSLKPFEVLDKLDLDGQVDGQGLKEVKAAADNGDRTGALAELLAYYREKYPLPITEVHNKALCEQKGFVQVAFTFQEFRDFERWMCRPFLSRNPLRF